MTNIELKTWFIDKINSCYIVNLSEIDNHVYLFYDEAVVRKMKLCKLNNVEFELNKITGKCLFEIDFQFNKIWCDYFNVWRVFEMNYNTIDIKIEKFIKNILKTQNNLNIVTNKAYKNHISYMFDDFNICTALLYDNKLFFDVNMFKVKKYIFNSYD